MKISLLLASLTIKIKEAGRYRSTAYFISVVITSLPFILSCIALIRFFFGKNIKRHDNLLMSYSLPLVIICILLLTHRKKYIESLKLPNTVINKSLIFYFLFLVLSIAALIITKYESWFL